LQTEVSFRAEREVPDVVARPVLRDPRIAVDDAAEVGVVDEQRIQVPIDPRVEEERTEDLRAILDADPERAREVPDVGVALNPVRAPPIPSHRPLTACE